MYLVFSRMPGESYRRRLRSLLLCLVWRLSTSLTPLCVDSSRNKVWTAKKKMHQDKDHWRNLFFPQTSLTRDWRFVGLRGASTCWWTSCCWKSFLRTSSGAPRPMWTLTRSERPTSTSSGHWGKPETLMGMLWKPRSSSSSSSGVFGFVCFCFVCLFVCLFVRSFVVIGGFFVCFFVFVLFFVCFFVCLFVFVFIFMTFYPTGIWLILDNNDVNTYCLVLFCCLFVFLLLLALCFVVCLLLWLF